MKTPKFLNTKAIVIALFLDGAFLIAWETLDLFLAFQNIPMPTMTNLVQYIASGFPGSTLIRRILLFDYPFFLGGNVHRLHLFLLFRGMFPIATCLVILAQFIWILRGFRSIRTLIISAITVSTLVASTHLGLFPEYCLPELIQGKHSEQTIFSEGCSLWRFGSISQGMSRPDVEHMIGPGLPSSDTDVVYYSYGCRNDRFWKASVIYEKNVVREIRYLYWID